MCGEFRDSKQVGRKDKIGKNIRNRIANTKKDAFMNHISLTANTEHVLLCLRFSCLLSICLELCRDLFLLCRKSLFSIISIVCFLLICIYNGILNFKSKQFVCPLSQDMNRNKKKQTAIVAGIWLIEYFKHTPLMFRINLAFTISSYAIHV